MGGDRITRWLAALFIVLLFPVAPRVVAATGALGLDDYYAAALRRSESTAIQLEQVRQAEERYTQAHSAILPNVTAVAGTTWQDPVADCTAASCLGNQPTARITLSQPLFRGLREYAALRQTQNLLSAQEQDYRHAQVQLYKDVLQNFYSILSLESQVANYSEEARLNREREADIRARVRIGRATDSDLLNLQSTLSTLQANIGQMRGQLQVAREAFAFLSGLDANTPLRDTTTLPARVEPVERYLDRLQDRPDVYAARQRQVAAGEAVKIANGARLPSLDLNASYYLQRPGVLNDSKWDLALAFSVPLYSGGAIASKVREAESQRTQADLNQSLVLRQAEQEIRSLYTSVLASLNQLQALRAATDAAKRSYQAQLRDYRLGLVNNLDVIQALTSYQQNQRALDGVELATRSNYLQLQAAVLHLPLPSATP